MAVRNSLLTFFDGDSKTLGVVIETPKGSRCRFKYDESSGLFKLVRVLPAGAAFPFHFGFLPATLGEGEDPLQVLMLMEEPLFPACLVAGRLIGVIEATQTTAGNTAPDNRLLAVALESTRYGKITSIEQVEEKLLKQIEDFFVAYSSTFGKSFVPLCRLNADSAAQMVCQGMEAFKNRK
jgi:inorganic pyrophosphatase